ncbi:calcium-responsive transcription factor-like, partial [Centroberyx affinis]|uniref:calcium-responsive transcription factor-like n=1 Tax=Centroberyx affinis TaxID=166261 RepID=UPI003A5BB17C
RFCSSDSELEAILLLHKQQTGCVFGTRQSPSVTKPATRLMWKSQYVPYDGIPFVNTGSRAIVMECQYGPRRKGLQPKKNSEQPQLQDYKATCPARIYIKKVRKFPEFRVPSEPTADRKTVRQEQEKAFCSLRSQTLSSGGAVRYYLQLPTEKAHLYHDVATPIPPPPPDLLPPAQLEEEEETEEEGGEEGGEEAGDEDSGLIPSRLHPRVAERIRQLVAEGQHQVYSVRKQLRRFVERELFQCEGLPERHNLCYFPTVNDIKNHIHESQKALGLTGATAEWTAVCSDALTETVTLTLTPAAAEVLDGSDTLSPEAVQLFSSLSSLQPKIFAQLQGIQLQPVTPPQPPTQEPPITSSTSSITSSSTSSSASSSNQPVPAPSTSSPALPDSSLSSPQPLLFFSSSSSSTSLHPSPHLSPSQSFFQPSGPSGESPAACGPQEELGAGPGLSVSPLGDGGTHHIVLENGDTIPVQIVQPAAIALTGPDILQVEVKEEERDEEEAEEEEEEEEEETNSAS